jgi:hypothetical protein
MFVGKSYSQMRWIDRAKYSPSLTGHVLPLLCKKFEDDSHIVIGGVHNVIWTCG